MFKGIEGDDANRVIELPRHQIGDDRFEVCPLYVGFAVCGAKPAKAVDDEIDRLDPRRRALSVRLTGSSLLQAYATSYQTQTQRRGI